MKSKTSLLIAAASLSASLLGTVSASAQSLSLFTLPEGNTIIQVTGAVPNNNPGGQASADTRTAYFFEPDFGDPVPNEPDFPGTGPGGTWPWIYAPADAVLGDLNIDSGITATVSLLENPNSAANLQWILVDGNPIYQFINDNSATDANGNFGPWNFIQADGTPSQALVPEPSTYAAIGGALALAVAMATRRLRRKRAAVA
ncbi:MAG: PEP-CTERM sorting domain-containing protein [Opitutales bacterium]